MPVPAITRQLAEAQRNGTAARGDVIGCARRYSSGSRAAMWAGRLVALFYEYQSGTGESYSGARLFVVPLNREHDAAYHRASDQLGIKRWPEAPRSAVMLAAMMHACQRLDDRMGELVPIIAEEERQKEEQLGRDMAESMRRAKLASAAPDMLAALKAFLRAPSVGSDGPGSVTIVVQDFNMKAAREAVAKAET